MQAKVTPMRIAFKLITGFVIMAGAFFGSAGTCRWPEAWLYLLLQFSFSTVTALWLKRHDPALLADRMIFCKPTARGWDKLFMWISTVIFVPYLLLPGLDAVRYQWSEVPPCVEAVGFLGVAISLAILFRVMQENRYLSRVVEIQKDRGHRVIDTGPYRYVRHPMYGGVIILFFSLPIALGSLWTIAPAFLLTVLLLLRTRFEDKLLHEELDGYRAYAQKTPYRIMPGIW